MKPMFAKESDLCAAFIASLPSEWQAYPETGGFDILLVRKADGVQIGVEAKLRLNAKVVVQAAESVNHYETARPGPDFRAALIPHGVGLELAALCPLVGVTVIRMSDLALSDAGEAEWFDAKRSMARLSSGGYSAPFHPSLPSLNDGLWDSDWFERCPSKRIAIPDYVPDVVAGASAPVALTSWKIGAIKLVILLGRRGYLTRADFVHFRISMSRWTQERWLTKDGQGGWIAGRNLPDFRAQHPTNFAQIEADFEKWKPATSATIQRDLFVEVGRNEKSKDAA
jgi:hypothetical protein